MSSYNVIGNEETGYTLKYKQGTRTIDRPSELSYSVLSKIKEVILPESAEIINESCFEQISSIETIKGLENVQVIKNRAFEFCGNLKNITFGEKLEFIGNEAFAYCENLKEVDVPDSVKCIGDRAFKECSKLEWVRLPRELYCINENTFDNCINLFEVNLPEALRIIGDNAFCNCRSLKKLDLPSHLTEIGDCAFSECAIENLVIPYNVTHLEKTFTLCDNLKKVEFQNESIRLRGTFEGCSQLEDIGNLRFDDCSFNTFKNCPNITEVKVSEKNLSHLNYPFYEDSTAWDYFPVNVYSISNPPSCPIRKCCESEDGWNLQYEIKKNELKLYGPMIGDSKEKSTIEKVAKFINDPKYENFTEISEAQNKMLLAVAYCDYDRRYETYAKKYITGILRYAGETEDFQLVTAIIDHDLISNRVIDKCIDFIRDEEYHEMFIMLAQYKEEKGGYEKNNQERFEL